MRRSLWIVLVPAVALALGSCTFGGGHKARVEGISYERSTASWETCATEGFSVRYPSEWTASADCSSFDPGTRDETAITLMVEEGTVPTVAARRLPLGLITFSDVGERLGSKWEMEPAKPGLPASYHYLVDLGDNTVISAVAVGQPGPNYEAASDALDSMVTTLR